MKKAFLLGFRKTLPFQTGVIPFGVLYSTLAANSGLSWWMVMALSIIVFGGSSQLVFIDLYKNLTSGLQAAMGANIVNARHLIYSAGVSRRFSQFKLHWKIILSYLLTDQLYAISQTDLSLQESFSREELSWYYFGSGFCTWIFWQLACGFGGLFGHLVPFAWNLGFSIPLIFMPMLFSVSTHRASYVAALLAATLVFVLKDLPLGLNVFVSILLASFIPFSIERKLKKEDRP